LKSPNSAGKVKKAELRELFSQIQKRKSKGMVYYPIRGAKRRAKFEALFDSEAPSDIFKGGWIDAVKSSSGKAELKFDKDGNPKFNFEGKLISTYIPLDGEQFLADPDGYISRLLKRWDTNQIFYPVTIKDQICQGYGGSKSSLPTISDILQMIDADSGGDTKRLGDFIGALLTYEKP
jgi:hypothetical protein